MRLTGPFNLDDLAEREWLLTNGLGGYASATLCGMHTRRYHGLLVAALQPPGGRHLLVAKLEETLHAGGADISLATNQYADTIHPHGYRYLQSVEFTDHAFTMCFAAGTARLEKRITLVDGENTTCVSYRNNGDIPYHLSLTPLVNARDFHGETTAGSIHFHLASGAWGAGTQVHVRPEWMREGFRLYADAGAWRDNPHWYYRFYHCWEARRGLGALEDHFSPGHFTIELPAGALVTITLSTVPQAATPQCLPSPASSNVADEPMEVDHLRAAACGFLVQRQAVRQAQLSHGRTVIAGYHWFGDWGRDTMIALPGLCLLAGQNTADAADILRTFAAARRHGLLPNVFADTGEGEAYNAVDASLWFINAVDQYYRATSDAVLVTELRPALEEIIHCYQAGTDYGIGMDDDGLIFANAPGWQLTWMDAKVGDWVVTPRQGKPVEINALWYNALRILETCCRQFGWEGDYGTPAERVRSSFSRFWNADGGYLFDVLGDTPDARIRPNQIFAVSLTHSPLDHEHARRVVDVVREHLLTPYGLRSLSPHDPDYRGRYGGNQWERDGAYHQGTVWGWLIGPYVEAYLRVNGHSDAAKSHCRSLLQPLLEHTWSAGLGTISEIFDGDPPHAPHGTISQAWSVAEFLRAWDMCRA